MYIGEKAYIDIFDKFNTTGLHRDYNLSIMPTTLGNEQSEKAVQFNITNAMD